MPEAISVIFFALIGIACVAWLAWVARLSVAARKRRREWQERSPLNDEEFGRACARRADPAQAALAVTIRRALAKSRGVPAETIRAEDGFADRFWDSLDWLGVILEVELRAGVEVVGPVIDEAQRLAAARNAELQVQDVVQAIVAAATPGSPPRASAKGARAALL